ncbi:MAG: C4-dicarboxylate ABC transporter permease [Candidatus Marinimicrobia bacterium]|nr:C4-dicarboxylate ABC transporter permease [Candidatus Neomarinimicrobiota bacterium]
MIGASASIVGFLGVLLIARVWVAIALFAAGLFALSLIQNLPIDKILAISIWNVTTSTELLALPLFILMAEILSQTNLSRSMFRGLAPWTAKLPGNLLHVNVVGCTLFAAISGSSAATTLTIGRITLKELLARGYDKSLAIGSLAGAGTLGFLIPPSLIMIIYGVLAEASILKLFLAGIVPGLILATLYSIYIGVRTSLDPSLAQRQTKSVTWRDRFLGLVTLLPVTILITAVIGSFYFGIASPTEAAAVGVFGAITIAAWQGRLTVQSLITALLGAVRISSMAGMILAAGSFFSVCLAYLGTPQAVLDSIADLNLNGVQLILVLLAIYLVLGLFLDGMSTIIMTLPITLPLVIAAGYDPIWFGVFLVLAVEMAQITPPVGFNLFVLQSLTGESISRIARYAFPFFVITMIVTVLIVIFPQIVLFPVSN